MGRLASIKHYFLLDQGDFFVHFLDSAEEELVKPVAQIAKGRLQSKLELSLRQVWDAAATTTSTSTTSECGINPTKFTQQQQQRGRGAIGA